MAEKRTDKKDSLESSIINDHQFQAMLRIATTVLRCVDLDEILSAITSELCHVIDFDRSSVAFLSPNSDKLILRDIFKLGKNKDEKHGEGRGISVEPANVIGWVALTKEPVIRNDIDADDRFTEIVKEEPFKSDMVVPLIARGDLIGTLNVGSYRKNAFSNTDLEILKNCGKFACVAIEHVILLKEAKELGQRYKLLQENANDIIMLIDKNSGKIAEANRKCELVFGYSRGELLKKSYFDLFAREDLFEARRDFINILSKQSQSLIDRRMISGDNRIIFVDINTNLIRIHDDTFIQVIVHDISQRKMLEQQIIFQNKHLQEINKKLREVDKMKTEFLANISHELRTPLSIIIAYSESIREESISNEDRRKFLDVIAESSEHLLSLINNLLDLSKLEISGKMLNLTLSHVHDVIRSTMPKMEKEAKRKGIQLSFRAGYEIPVIYFDNNQILQVVTCLISNAIKFTDKGGRVEISTALRDDEILIRVADNGAGIPSEEITHIFTTFHQVDGSSSRRWGGMGIGLALANHIVNLHRGNLWVESEFGQGSEFTFSLPLDTEEIFLGEKSREERVTADYTAGKSN